VVLTVRGNLVFVAESFPLEVARKLTALVLDAQGAGELRMAQSTQPAMEPAKEAMQPLTSNLIRLFANCGVMKAAVDAVQAAR